MVEAYDDWIDFFKLQIFKEVKKIKIDAKNYDDLENDTRFLAEFSSRKKIADFAGFIAFDEDGEECFSFGKHKGKKVTEILEREPRWL